MKLLPMAALLLVLPLTAQQEPIPDQPFSESIDVSVANVEVYVTDRQGQPVQGLPRDEFELLVDGRKVEIVNFAEIAEGSVRAAAPASKAPSVETPAASAEPGEAAPASVPAPEPLSLVVYVDNDNLRPFSRNRVLRQLRGVLDSMVGPRDRIMVVTHDQGLHVRRPLSPGKESLAADLQLLEKLGARGIQQDNQRRQTMQLIRDMGCTDEAERIVSNYAQGVSADAKMTLNALASMVESLSGLEGRKAVLYVTDGVEMHPGEDLFEMLGKLCGINTAFKTEDLAAPFRRLTDLANASGVTFYTLEAAGLRNVSTASAEETAPPPGLSLADLEFTRRNDVQQVLFNLASETGGRAVLNGNDIKADLARMAEDLSSYYSLGYTPARSGDGKVHTIEVKVKRQGLRVRNRTTYTDRPREQRLAARVQTALLHGVVDNPLQAALELVSSQPGERGQHLVTLRLRVPLKQLVLVSQDAAWAGRMTLWIGARDAAGRMAPVQSVRVPVRIPAPEDKTQLDGRTFAYDIRMRMAERGEQTVAVGILDELGQISSFITASFRVDKQGVTAASAGR